MRVLVCGDIVGKSGRNSIKRELPNLINDKNLDFVLVNGENSANGNEVCTFQHLTRKEPEKYQ